jgi:AcrR family transcriptional regulator
MADRSSVRWRRRKDARPAEILAAALDCFAGRGFAATRLEDIAARAGVTKGTLYLYFPNKEELFKALVRQQLLPNIERLEAVAAGAPGPASELLGHLAAVFATHVVPSRAAVIPKLIIAEAGNFPELAKFYLHEVIERAFRVLRSILRRGVESGEFRDIDVEHTAFCVVGPLLLSALWKHSFEPHADHPLDVEALCRAHLDALLNGIRRPAAAAGPEPASASRPPRKEATRARKRR